ncbi:MAG: hypothetical protein ACTHLU_11820, partial [Novosphingobium sp.]
HLGVQMVTTGDGVENGGQFKQFNPDGSTSNPLGVPQDQAVVGLSAYFGTLRAITAPQSVVDQVRKNPGSNSKGLVGPQKGIQK